MVETLVIGGGIVGSSVGYHLSRANVETCLVDRNDPGDASSAAAGVVSPATSSQNADPVWYNLAVRAFTYYDDLIEQLRNEQGGPTGFARRPVLAVAVSESELDEYHELLERTERRVGESAAGYLEEGSVRELDFSQAREQFPPLTDPVGTFRVDDAARVDGGTLSEALVRAGSATGLSTKQASVTDLLIEDDRVTGVRTEAGEELSAERVVISGGAWSSVFGEALGSIIPVEPIRGQVVHTVPEADPAEWPMVITFADKVMAPWPDRRVAIGATREPDVGFDDSLTVGGISEVLDEIKRVAAGLVGAAVTDFRTGLRPVTPDGLPLLGRHPSVDGVYLATGHGATGITHGPYTGKLLADQLTGMEPAVDLEPFSPARFA